jgi:hypothetical protein
MPGKYDWQYGFHCAQCGDAKRNLQLHRLDASEWKLGGLHRLHDSRNLQWRSLHEPAFRTFEQRNGTRYPGYAVGAERTWSHAVGGTREAEHYPHAKARTCEGDEFPIGTYCSRDSLASLYA